MYATFVFKSRRTFIGSDLLRFALTVVLFVVTSSAQQIKVRVILEKSGKPLPNRLLEITSTQLRKPLMVQATALGYVADIAGSKTIYVSWIGNAPRHYWSDYVVSIDCKYGGLGMTSEVTQIVESGVTVGNWCGDKRLAPQPPQAGELLVIVRRVHWWEKID